MIWLVYEESYLCMMGVGNRRMKRKNKKLKRMINKLEIYNQLRFSIWSIYEKTLKDVRDNIGLNSRIASKTNSNFAPKSQKGMSKSAMSPSQMDMSLISKARSGRDDKSDLGVDDNDIEILSDYHQFFIQRKQAIIDQWEKDRSEEKKEMQHKRMQKTK